MGGSESRDVYAETQSFHNAFRPLFGRVSGEDSLFTRVMGDHIRRHSPQLLHDDQRRHSGNDFPIGPRLRQVLLPYCVGQWLPSDEAILSSWMNSLSQRVEALPEYNKACAMIDSEKRDHEGRLLPLPGLLVPIQELKDLVEHDSVVNMCFLQMISQIPDSVKDNPEKEPQLKKYLKILYKINHVIRRAPEYTSEHTGVVGVPITAILAWNMGTNAGTMLFLNEKVNKALKKILNCWSAFLKTEDSKYVLPGDKDNPDKGWLGKNAMEEMSGFVDTFKCDPNDPHFGFNSWDDFFTRELKEGARPIASPHDDSVIVNACESVPYKLRKNIQRQSRFWIKSQPYSLLFMLANDPLIEQFVGGTVYQAFLSSRSYHRWHSPVNGKIVKAYVVDGSYYAELEFDSFEKEDRKLQNESQAYLTEVATRALVFIQADNPDIGLMCFMAVGMVEVSSCDITVYEGEQVKKGQQLGMFHYGGSTHCLIFRRGIELKFHVDPENQGTWYAGVTPKTKHFSYTAAPCNCGFDFPLFDGHHSKPKTDKHSESPKQKIETLLVNSKIATVL